MPTIKRVIRRQRPATGSADNPFDPPPCTPDQARIACERATVEQLFDARENLRDIEEKWARYVLGAAIGVELSARFHLRVATGEPMTSDESETWFDHLSFSRRHFDQIISRAMTPPDGTEPPRAA